MNIYISKTKKQTNKSQYPELRFIISDADIADLLELSEISTYIAALNNKIFTLKIAVSDESKITISENAFVFKTTKSDLAKILRTGFISHKIEGRFEATIMHKE